MQLLPKPESTARVRAYVDAGRHRLERTICWRVWERLVENEFLDRSVALGAKAFVSFFPAIIVVAAFLPASVRNSITSTIISKAGLRGDGLDSVRRAFATSNDVRRSTGILGLILTFFYINSFFSALQRVYLRAWRRPAARVVSRYALGGGWLAAVVVYFSLLGGFRALLSGARAAGYAPVALLATMVMWLLTPWLLLERQVRLRVLVPTAILTGAGMAVYYASASVWMPQTIAKNQAQFGFFGVALSLVTWLTGASTIIVVAASAGAVFADDPGRIGAMVRGSAAAPVTRDG
jgi:membrane protein